MTELKTLKDLRKVNNVYGKLVFKKDLKAEAIKWVKEADEKCKNAIDKNRLVVYEYWNGRKMSLMDFFNITSQELENA